MIECACGQEGCKTTLSVGEVNPKFGNVLIEIDHHTEPPRWAHIYLDANSIVQLIRELRVALLALTE